MWETWIQSLGQEDPLEKGKATHTSILAWNAIDYIVHGVAESDKTERLSLSLVCSDHKQSINKKNSLKNHYKFLIIHILPLGSVIPSGICPTITGTSELIFHLEREWGMKKVLKNKEEERRLLNFGYSTMNQILSLNKMFKLTKKNVCHDAQNFLPVVKQVLGSISSTQKRFFNPRR